ncbi:MAG: hypothetical protein COT39_04040 [Parcubacteria group bacterium CG08_land_8_20_14_0_20_48_21]|nr:MAG: hypothetical protein AUK21_00605 [Parcubacteria group bacterium CG2_30_48_51]PIS32529.1 MAG: hypothetical protein COT39_04040 [Parcubacteria group bacterium CG08_land_8_20_14_0_20_48_21]PIW79480.1 MAG: hypothetical protein COZ99_00800 [Parcubacteria group bacterium CG_4_8_14_3_um_filter_48_16]PIY77911.1 MAG: hypothetical protein COY83_02555 [Parcubacteria group bacterium CG_4_10_14_0_8_um_filter_48_154]PJC39611.1 MAG: hypothetical protein CO043_03290 [Parcubacteria group bacterium CG_4_
MKFLCTPSKLLFLCSWMFFSFSYSAYNDAPDATIPEREVELHILNHHPQPMICIRVYQEDRNSYIEFYEYGLHNRRPRLDKVVIVKEQGITVFERDAVYQEIWQNWEDEYLLLREKELGKQRVTDPWSHLRKIREA